MTGTNDKLRSLFLAMLMVTSVFAGTIALTGSAAAAANSSSFDTLDPSTVNDEETVTHDYQINIDDLQADGNTDTLTVTLPSVASFDTGASNTASVTEAGQDNDIAVDDVSFADANGGTNNQLIVTISPESSDFDTGTPYDIEFSGVVTVQFPAVDSQTTVDVDYEFTDSGGSDVSGSTPVTINDAAPATPEVLQANEDNGDLFVTFNTDTVNASTGSAIGSAAGQAEVYVRQPGDDADDYTEYEVGSADVNPSNNGNNLRYTIDTAGLTGSDISPAADVLVDFGTVRAQAASAGNSEEDLGNVSVDLTSATVVDTSDTGTDSSPQRIYAGSPIRIVSDTTGEPFELYNNDTDTLLLDARMNTGAESIVYDSNRLQTDTTYRVDFGGGDSEYFRINPLDFNADLEEDGTLFEHNENAEITVSGSAVRTNANGVEVTVDGPSTQYDTTGYNNLGEFEETFNYTTSLDAGDYTVTVTDVATGAEVTAGEFSVDEFPSASSASFGGGVFEEERGDVVSIPIELSDSSEGAQATVAVGDLSDTNYITNVTVADEDGDGEVNLLWNTYMSGTGVQDRIFTAEGEDNVTAFGGERGGFVTAVRGGENVGSSLDYAGNGILDSASYDLMVAANTEDVSEVTERGDYNFSDNGVDPEDVGTVSINSRATESSQVWVVPSEKKDQVDLEFIDENVDNTEDPIDGNLTQSDLAAEDEMVVHQISASGIEGVLRNRTDAGDNETIAFLREEQNYADTNNRQNTGVFNATFTQENQVANQIREKFNLNVDNTAVIPDYDNDTYYVAVDLSEVNEDLLTDERVWNASFEFESYNSIGPTIGGEGEGTVSSLWTYEDATASIDTNSEDEVIIRNQAGQTIRGDTNVAPGTQLGLRINSQSDTSPFLITLNTHVTEDRTFAATGDFSNRGSGINFTVQTRRGGTPLGSAYDGMILAEATATVTFSDQAVVEGNQEVVVDSVTLSDGGFIAIHEGSASGDVIGTSRYLEAGQRSNVRVDLDSPINETTTLVAMPHLDDNSNNLYDFPEADAPYTADGSAVTDSASVSVGSQTATPTDSPTPTATDEPTPTATDEPTPTATDEPTPTATDSGSPTASPTEEPPETPEPTTTGDGPGFGVAVSLIALLAAALLTARRRD